MAISATIITFNEEKNIERCLKSLQGVVDEIIVVDSFSTDNTEALCRQYDNVRFIHHPWSGYSGSKNYANSLASHDYILSLDADEALSPELQHAIQQAQQQGLRGVYQINRLSNYCGKWIKHSGWYPEWKTRLFPKKSCQWQGEFVHETLAFPNTLPLTKLHGDCYHYSYYSTEEHQQRANKYARLVAQQLAARHKQCSHLKPYISAFWRFVTMYLIRVGFLDGKMGFMIAKINAKANIIKYKELIKLNKEKASSST